MIPDNFYTYALLDPRKPGVYEYGEYKFDYEPFYVGKGCNGRCYDHLKELNLEEHSHKNHKIKKIMNEGFEVIIVKYKIELLEGVSFELEIDMIKTIGRADLGLGPLTNMTDGGEGVYGRIISEEERNKRSESMRGKNTWTKGVPRTEETKNKISKSCKGKNTWIKGKKQSPEQIRKSAESRKGIKQSLKTTQKRSESMKGITHSEERKLKNSESHKGIRDSTETKKKKSESHKGKNTWSKGTKRSPETIQKHIETLKRNKLEKQRLEQLNETKDMEIVCQIY